METEVMISDDDNDEEAGEKKLKKIPYHCHFSQFKVTDELLAHMADGQPNKHYKAKGKEKQEAAKVEEIIMKNKRQEDEVSIKII